MRSRFPDPRDILQNAARILVYPLFLLNGLLLGLLCSPCVCVYCAWKRRPWNISSDAYVLDERNGEEDEPEHLVETGNASSLPDAPTKGLSTPSFSCLFPSFPEKPSTTINIKDVKYSTLYLSARDGTRLAVDVWLPPACKRAEGRKVGCVLHQARYYRSFKLWGPGNLARNGLPINLLNNEYFERFLSQGLAVVSMDIRGSGASFGCSRGPWLEVETEDAMVVMDWILHQPWSNGRLGLWGISYEGTRALLSGVAGHRGVKAVVPMYMFLDVYSDVGFIGGMHLRGFVQNWERITRLLDHNKLPKIVFPFTDGVQPVSSAGPATLKAALREHRGNWR
ncbi:hypothetical protein NSK_004180 [Nannochloropsis salina CCMP1776]|uniref:Xaa-Pro dipeptidyl-peptidase-like domain-containing protein n=1 Tax=Nannochloropsis salina CCMP1776 TaxID=1027361 RepID=A0A4D9D6I4_9STRA|nr:hypothetical protein NSK_004180 [Nannochloropsis salina CCMP1776]|eukprot:TFJ84189.1 hypothetical protein NSK_004180 [Nannochloropsis salina CCMP1776]